MIDVVKVCGLRCVYDACDEFVQSWSKADCIPRMARMFDLQEQGFCPKGVQVENSNIDFEYPAQVHHCPPNSHLLSTKFAVWPLNTI